ncbi:hypothetical protein THOM_0222 [Trachipleistophora hominis]|uniref:Uncharacterized protein n=1 Tax=Trachipleistophora hominis TaxID=72359 RepID=L7JZA4_TRAHO|nr:hypothetical protein THOM_0222 [Trachipleistophora hominis]
MVKMLRMLWKVKRMVGAVKGNDEDVEDVEDDEENDRNDENEL